MVTMQRARISSYAQKVGVILARRAIMTVNKIHDITMYNASSQSNALKGTGLRVLACAKLQREKINCTSVYLYSVWRLISENFNPNGLILAEDMNENINKENKKNSGFGEVLQ